MRVFSHFFYKILIGFLSVGHRKKTCSDIVLEKIRLVALHIPGQPGIKPYGNILVREHTIHLYTMDELSCAHYKQQIFYQTMLWSLLQI
jgi:hypothetical protein